MVFHLLPVALFLLCSRAILPYLSPHKLRHGHVVHALKQARDLVGNDVRDAISHLGQERAEEVNSKIAELLELLKKG